MNIDKLLEQAGWLQRELEQAEDAAVIREQALWTDRESTARTSLLNGEMEKLYGADIHERWLTHRVRVLGALLRQQQRELEVSLQALNERREAAERKLRLLQQESESK